MNTFTLNIDTDNEAFSDDPSYELARILRDIADQLEQRDYGMFQTIYDINGNDVGRYALKSREYLNR